MQRYKCFYLCKSTNLKAIHNLFCLYSQANLFCILHSVLVLGLGRYSFAELGTRLYIHSSLRATACAGRKRCDRCQSAPYLGVANLPIPIPADALVRCCRESPCGVAYQRGRVPHLAPTSHPRHYAPLPRPSSRVHRHSGRARCRYPVVVHRSERYKSTPRILP